MFEKKERIEQKKSRIKLSTFSRYLEQEEISVTTSTYLLGAAYSWFTELQNGFEELAKHYPDTLCGSYFGIVSSGDEISICKIQFDNFYEASQDKTPDEFVSSMDTWFISLINKINDFFLKSYQVGAEFFPLQKGQTGVEMICRVRGGDNQIIYTTSSAHSALGARTTPQIRRRIDSVRNESGLTYLDDALKKTCNKKFLEDKTKKIRIIITHVIKEEVQLFYLN